MIYVTIVLVFETVAGIWKKGNDMEGSRYSLIELDLSKMTHVKKH
jgi:hypothetical protein